MSEPPAKTGWAFLATHRRVISAIGGGAMSLFGLLYLALVFSRSMPESYEEPLLATIAVYALGPVLCINGVFLVLLGRQGRE